MIFDRAIRRMENKAAGSEILSLDNSTGWELGNESVGKSQSLKLSAVNRCVACLTDSMSKLPVFVFDNITKEHLDTHPLARILAVRPNEAMTPSTYKKLMENNRLLGGNGYAAILRSPNDAGPRELLPIPPSHCRPHIDDGGKLWYIFTNPKNGELRKLYPSDVLHYKAYSDDGITGVSVLTHAAEVIRIGLASQSYENKFLTQNAQPSGILTVDTDLEKKSKDKIREEWNKIHSGVDNAFRIAVLDMGLKFQPISINNRDAQFIESKAVTVADIARFFSVPLYKLFEGKQAYNSNEQNGIEYVVGTLHPTVTQCEEEDSYKLLFDSELRRGLWISRNMMAELKGDTSSRGQWYKQMREVGVYSPNDICALEDRPDVPGGDTRYASLNYVPLELFEWLSIQRNGGKKR